VCVCVCVCVNSTDNLVVCGPGRTPSSVEVGLAQPAYLRSSLHACHSTRSLRLSNTYLLSAPFVRTSFGSHSRQAWYLSSSPQDPLLPTGLPIHLTPLLLCFRFGFCWPLCAFINYINLLARHTKPAMPVDQWMLTVGASGELGQTGHP